MASVMRGLFVGQRCVVAGIGGRRTMFARKSRHNMTLRCASSKANKQLINVSTIEDVPGVAVLQMNAPPVNSFSLEFLKQFNAVLRGLENDDSMKGVILTSAIPRLYSAGIDINEMYQASEERLSEFWHCFQDLFITLYGSSLVTIAAINGHAIAGGCAITQLCDYRILTSSPNTKLKLNSTELGLPPPLWIQQSVKNNVGHRNCERIWQSAQMFDPQMALKLVLVDELFPEEEVFGAAVREMRKWLEADEFRRVANKAALRKSTLDILTLKTRSQEIQQIVKYILSYSCQQVLKDYFESLRQKETDRSKV